MGSKSVPTTLSITDAEGLIVHVMDCVNKGEAVCEVSPIMALLRVLFCATYRLLHY